MTVALVRAYLLANALFLVVAVIVRIVRTASEAMRPTLSYRQQLRFARVLIAAAIVGPCLTLLCSGGDFLPTMMQIWAAPSMSAVGVSTDDLTGVTISTGTSGPGMSFRVLAQAAVSALLVGVGLAFGRILAGMWSVRRALNRAQLIRRAGALWILSSDETCVPFSCWAPGACYIVVPSSLILRPRDLRIALRHEAQHHRHGDTRIVFAMEFLRGAFFLNPVMPFLLKQLRCLQEFACDEALVRDSRIVAREYCECLLRVAQSSVRNHRLTSCLHMADPNSVSMLARRIGAVMHGRREYLGSRRAAAVNALAIVVLLGTSVGIAGSVQDRRVSLAEAQEMAAVARLGGSFPVVVDERVLRELNRFLGTPDGRAFMRDGLRRMGNHETLISAELARHGLPQELLAVPLVESGYRNLRQSDNPQDGAGIWMFIKPTARRFGLTVEAGRDERLNVASETEAAIRMFSHLHSEFADWSFALLAYNGGTELARRAVQEARASDAFVAAQRGYEYEAGYVARVTAALIVWRNTHRLRLGVHDGYVDNRVSSTGKP